MSVLTHLLRIETVLELLDCGRIETVLELLDCGRKSRNYVHIDTY